VETVDDPDLTAPLNMAIGDFVMAWVNEAILPDVAWSAVREEATHRRLTGDDELLNAEQSVEAQLEETVKSLTGIIKQHTDDLDYLHDCSVLYPLGDIASIAPRVIHPYIHLVQNILSEPPVDGSENGMYVLARCIRIIGYVGEAFPEVAETTAPSVIEFLQDVVKKERDDLLRNVLAGAITSAKRRPELLEPFREQLSNWCIDPPGADEMRIEVPTTEIQYYSIYGLHMVSDDATDKVLTEVTAETDTPQRVRELAEYVLNDG